MRRLWHVVGLFMVSCLLAGCGGSDESTATPDNLDAARDAAKKMQLREKAAAETRKSMPNATGGASAPQAGKRK